MLSGWSAAPLTCSVRYYCCYYKKVLNISDLEMSTPSTSLSDCLSSRGVSDDEVRLTSHPPRRLWSCQRGPDGPESRVHGNNGLRCWSAGYCRGPGLVNETMIGLHKILVATTLVAGGRTAPAPCE